MLHCGRVRVLSLLSVAAFLLSAFALNAGSSSAAVPLARQSFQIDSDRFRDGLLYVANSGTNSITAYPLTASGNARPVITLAGPHTGIVDPSAISSDAQGRLYVLSYGSNGQAVVLVFARGANGDRAPIRFFYPVFSEPNCLDAPCGQSITSMAVDPSGYIYAGGLVDTFTHDPNGTVGVFAPSAHGAAKPLRQFYNSFNYTSPGVAVNDAGQVYVIQSAAPEQSEIAGTLSAWSSFAAGNTEIYEAVFLENNFRFQPGIPLAVAPRSGDVFGVNEYSNQEIGVLNPQLTKVIRQFGSTIKLVFSGIAVDDAGELYIAGASGLHGPYSVEVFSAAASGNNPAPIRIITGPDTGLSAPFGITLIECSPHRGHP